GSGTSVQEVNQLLRQYAQMRKMFKSMGKGGAVQRRLMGSLTNMRAGR
ncbi:MAG: signal recognition particle protein, partial [Acidobacteriaceae bacterium]